MQGNFREASTMTRHELFRMALNVVLMVASLMARAQSPAGSVHGTITDPTGAVIPSSTITLTAADGTSRTATSGASGEYSIDQVVPGSYTVSASAIGFPASEPKAVSVGVEKSVMVNISLDL